MGNQLLNDKMGKDIRFCSDRCEEVFKSLSKEIKRAVISTRETYLPRILVLEVAEDYFTKKELDMISEVYGFIGIKIIGFGRAELHFTL